MIHYDRKQDVNYEKDRIKWFSNDNSWSSSQLPGRDQVSPIYYDAGYDQAGEVDGQEIGEGLLKINGKSRGLLPAINKNYCYNRMKMFPLMINNSGKTSPAGSERRVQSYGPSNKLQSPQYCLRVSSSLLSHQFLHDNNSKSTNLIGLYDCEKLFQFRTLFCEKSRTNSCPEKSRCDRSHCLTWQRRNPTTQLYVPRLCSDINFIRKHGDMKMQLSRKCINGKSCEYSHSKEEKLYHPLMYKTSECSSAACANDLPGRQYFCPFAHNKKELRVAITDEVRSSVINLLGLNKSKVSKVNAKRLFNTACDVLRRALREDVVLQHWMFYVAKLAPNSVLYSLIHNFFDEVAYKSVPPKVSDALPRISNHGRYQFNIPSSTNYMYMSSIPSSTSYRNSPNDLVEESAGVLNDSLNPCNYNPNNHSYLNTTNNIILYPPPPAAVGGGASAAASSNREAPSYNRSRTDDYLTYLRADSLSNILEEGNEPPLNGQAAAGSSRQLYYDHNQSSNQRMIPSFLRDSVSQYHRSQLLRSNQSNFKDDVHRQSVSAELPSMDISIKEGSIKEALLSPEMWEQPTYGDAPFKSEEHEILRSPNSNTWLDRSMDLSFYEEFIGGHSTRKDDLNSIGSPTFVSNDGRPRVGSFQDDRLLNNVYKNFQRNPQFMQSPTPKISIPTSSVDGIPFSHYSTGVPQNAGASPIHFRNGIHGQNIGISSNSNLNNVNDFGFLGSP